MTIETSTLDGLLFAFVALQGWIIRELFKVKAKLSVIISHCKHCPKELDTDRITRK